MYFSVLEPTSEPSPVVVEVPHSGLVVDPVSLATLAAPARSLGRDADLYVDQLYEGATARGASMLVAHVSRYVCDLNRGEDDLDAHAAEGGTALSAPHGLVWRTTTEDKPALLGPLPRDEIERRLRDIYRPYHQALEGLLRAKLDHFGFVILLCAHSMPSYGRAGHSDPGRHRADVVPGSRGGTTAARSVIDTPERVARSFGWTVRHDDPYKGGFSTGYYGHPERGVHALQVELARRLYMNEQNLQKDPVGFARTREFCLELTGALGRLDLKVA